MRTQFRICAKCQQLIWRSELEVKNQKGETKRYHRHCFEDFVQKLSKQGAKIQLTYVN